MSNALTKTSQYVQSLVDYVNDAKPFRSKLTEIVEEYQFNEKMGVKIVEANSMRTMHKATWVYDYFSGGNPDFGSFTAKHVLSPHAVANVFVAGLDENTDLSGVPSVFSKKQFDGAGVSDALLQHGSLTLPLVEGHDFFVSHGSMEIQIKRINDAHGVLSPIWVETCNDGVIAAATALTLTNEQDLTRPQSAVRLLSTFVTGIRSHLLINARPLDANYLDALAACNSLLASLNSGTIPQPYGISPTDPDLVLTGEYERIVNGADAALPTITAPFAYGAYHWKRSNPLATGGTDFIDEKFADFLPPLLFNMHSDADIQKAGLIYYQDASSTNLSITGVVANPQADYEEWTVRCITITPSLWQVSGSHSGVVGAVVAGSAFSCFSLSFNTANLGTPLVGEAVVLTPANTIVVHATAPAERWNLIETNPLAYTRPAFVSTRYGRITNLALGLTVAPRTVIITATSATTFSVTDSLGIYNTTATVGATFNNGEIAFLIVAGSAVPFVSGDTFLVEVVNKPASALNFDLYYGYDLDSYDNPNLLYDAPNAAQTIDFKWDSRFTDYNLGQMGLTLTQAAIDGRTYRLKAKADLASPVIVTQPSGLDPVALDPSISLYRASTFTLEWSAGGGAWTFVADVPVNTPYTNAAHGISFTIPSGSKPFIAAVVGGDTTLGGDVFSFTIDNPPPSIGNLPVGLMGATVPRLVMFGDGYFKSVTADWTVVFNSPTNYTISGIHADGPLINTPVAGYPITGTLSVAGADIIAGATYKDDNLYFTIKSGRGLSSNDTFTFSTLTARPTFMVYGSVSGWQPPAEYGKWYWNGKIGFKVASPALSIYRTGNTVPMGGFSGYYTFGTGYVRPTYLRPDVEAIDYFFERTTDGWMVSRSDLGVVGFCHPSGTFKDTYLEVEVHDTGANFRIHLHPTTFNFWNGQDVVIAKSSISVLNPAAGDALVLTKTEDGKLGIQLEYKNVFPLPVLTALSPFAIDTNYIDPGVLVNALSPEGRLITDWLPTYLVKRDATNSIAHFPDPTATFEMWSASSGKKIATLYPVGDPLTEPTLFGFDPTFFTTYLALNSKVNLVTYGTGLNDNVRVRMFESLDVLFSGNVLLESALFQDTFNVNIAEGTQWAIRVSETDQTTVVVGDTFTGFLPGYDNLPYDAEDVAGLGQYDTGRALTDVFMRAKWLDGQLVLTVNQQAELDTLIQQVSPFLTGNLSSTDLVTFLANMAADAYATGLSPAFGIPAQGLGISIDDKSTDGTAASVVEGMSIVSLDPGFAYDLYGFDSQPLDAMDERVEMVFAVANLSPLLLLQPTQFAITGTSIHTVEVTFTNAPNAMPTPSFAVFGGGSVGPVQKLRNGHYRFTIPNLPGLVIQAS